MELRNVVGLIRHLASFLFLSSLSMGWKGYTETSYHSYNFTQRRQPVVLMWPLLFFPFLHRCVDLTGNEFVRVHIARFCWSDVVLLKCKYFCPRHRRFLLVDKHFTLHTQYTSHFSCSIFPTSHVVGCISHSKHSILNTQYVSHFTRGRLYFTLQAQYISHFARSIFPTSHALGCISHSKHSILHTQCISHFPRGRLYHTPSTVYFTLHTSHTVHFPLHTR